MTAWQIRMLALDRRDTALNDRWLARSYLREGSRAMHRHHMRRALKSWIKFREYLDESKRVMQ